MKLGSYKKFLLPKFFESLSTSQFSKRSETTLIDGKLIAKKVLNDVKAEVDAFKLKYGRIPLLTCILVGDDAASVLYTKNKIVAAERAGIKANLLMLPSSITERDLTIQIHTLNKDNEIDGILLQLPLPGHVRKNVYNEICPKKDVDGFTSINLGKLVQNTNAFIPCTALAVHRILKELNVETIGRNTLICGRSTHVGFPIAMLLHSNFEYFGTIKKECSSAILVEHAKKKI